MANFFDFSSDKIDIFAMLIDSSGSMSDDAGNVRKGLEMYKKSFLNFPEAKSIAVSVSKFNSYYHPGDFKLVRDFDTSYYADGGTALFYSIVQEAEHLKSYIEEVTKRTGCIPKATFIVFSDGESYMDSMTENDGKKAISKLNYAGITTVFVAFGSGITSEFGKRLGFMSTINVTDRETLVEFLGVELSKSCKEQSRSLKGLGTNFFSQAVDSGNSNGYSNTTAQVLEDDSFIDDI